MTPTTTANGATARAVARDADHVATAAGIRVAVRQLVRRQAVPAAVANTALAALGIAPLYDRYVVGVRLVATVTVAAHTPAHAQRAAAGRIVTAARPLRAGHLRTHAVRAHAARRPAAESVTASRIVHIAGNPWSASHPYHTVEATVLLGITVTAADRDSAWTDAHRQLTAAIRALPRRDVHLHLDGLTKSWVRNLGPEPAPAPPSR